MSHPEAWAVLWPCGRPREERSPVSGDGPGVMFQDLQHPSCSQSALSPTVSHTVLSAAIQASPSLSPAPSAPATPGASVSLTAAFPPAIPLSIYTSPVTSHCQGITLSTALPISRLPSVGEHPGDRGFVLARSWQHPSPSGSLGTCDAPDKQRDLLTPAGT